ncbi:MULTISPECIES: hypothetical protein [Methylococcus]|uniref:hypothetical protein n=1 Tax=Methylococcus TaxID=413 RepID=UPI0018DF9A80|nr:MULTISPECIES: hypothetical protein [Methylococcus]MDF9392877.1 hypothetical protein [Methylococcus capsulatus]
MRKAGCASPSGLTGYYADLYAHEPLWAVLPASFIAAFFVVSVMVAGGAVLRFPWWFLAPMTLVSMACEGALRGFGSGRSGVCASPPSVS